MNKVHAAATYPGSEWVIDWLGEDGVAGAAAWEYQTFQQRSTQMDWKRQCKQ